VGAGHCAGAGASPFWAIDIVQSFTLRTVFCAQVAAELGVAPELVRLITGGNEFRSDATLLQDENMQGSCQLQVGALAARPTCSDVRFFACTAAALRASVLPLQYFLCGCFLRRVIQMVQLGAKQLETVLLIVAHMPFCKPKISFSFFFIIFNKLN